MTDSWFPDWLDDLECHDAFGPGINTMFPDGLTDEAGWTGPDSDPDPDPDPDPRDPGVEDKEEDQDDLTPALSMYDQLENRVRAGPSRSNGWKISTTRRCELEWKEWSR